MCSLKYLSYLPVPPCSEFTANGRSPESNRQPEKRRLKPLVFHDVIFLAFLSGKVGQPVHNLLQVTVAV